MAHGYGVERVERRVLHPQGVLRVKGKGCTDLAERVLLIRDICFFWQREGGPISHLRLRLLLILLLLLLFLGISFIYLLLFALPDFKCVFFLLPLPFPFPIPLHLPLPLPLLLQCKH